MTAPTLDDIRAAQTRIRPYIHRTPVLTCATLDGLLGAKLYFKCENLQKVGAFKARGATNAVLCLDDAEAARGVVTHSSGNHAAALSWAAGLRGVPAFIVMPTTAPRVKVAAVEKYGGRITFCEPTLAAREDTTSQIQQQTGATLIHPYDDERIIAGQGTAAVEFLEDVPELDIIMTPVGGGGLLAGTAIAAQAIKPGVTVWAGEPREVDDACRSLQTGERQPATGRRSIADGLLTSLGERTFPIVKERVDRILLADEATIHLAQRWIMERMKLVVEPSAAVPLAALWQHDDREAAFGGRRIGIVLSGGNVDLTSLFDSK